MAEHSTPRLRDEPLLLDGFVGGDQVWSVIVSIAEGMRTDGWALIGGQMVALHGFGAGVVPPRATMDIDIVADVVVRRTALRQCADLLESLDFQPQPSISGKTLHRFVGARGQVDLVVPDHVPSSLAQKLRGHRPVAVAGGRRALDRAARLAVVLDNRHADVLVPDLRGALVLKARAAIADRRNSDRHLSDLAFLCSLVADPLGLADALDAKERRSVRRVHLSADATMAPWVFLPAAVRHDAAETWSVLTR